MASFQREYLKTRRTDLYDAIDPSKNLQDAAKGKSVLVTGSARGIGKAIAFTFARAGAPTVVLVDLDKDALEAAAAELQQLDLSHAPQIITHVTDICCLESMNALFNDLDQLNISLDVLVNNAGVMSPIEKIHESDPDTWWKTWEVNVKGVYLATQAVLKRKMEADPNGQKKLHIITTTSSGGLSTRAGWSAYRPSKTAANRFVEHIVAEYGDKGVIAHAFHPGAVATTLAKSRHSPEEVARLADTPALAGGFVLWLCSTSEADILAGRFLMANWDVNGLLEAIKSGAIKEDTLKFRVSA